jgi:hypothetical protein
MYCSHSYWIAVIIWGIMPMNAHEFLAEHWGMPCWGFEAEESKMLENVNKDKKENE